MKTTIFITLLITLQVNSQNTNIPDTAFEQALIDLGHDSGPINGIVSTANINNIIEINLSYRGISDLTGISDFTSLEFLYCDNNNLNSIDVSGNLSLRVLVCGFNNSFNILDVSNNPHLIYLYCYNLNLPSLDLSNNPNLLILGASGNNLTSLDLSDTPDLIKLLCKNNNLGSLDLSDTPDLKNLYCDNAGLTSLDLSNNPNLEKLTCSHNILTELDLHFLPNLTTVIVENNNLNLLNVKNSNNTNLNTFKSTGNPNLNCISVDNVTYSTNNWTSNIDSHTSFNLDCDSGLSVLDFDISQVFIGPNPMNNILKIDIDNTNIKNVKLYDITGKLMVQTKINSIDVNSLKSGLYILKLIKLDGEIIIKKMIKE